MNTLDNLGEMIDRWEEENQKEYEALRVELLEALFEPEKEKEEKPVLLKAA